MKNRVRANTSTGSTSSLLRKQAVAPVLNVCVWCARLWLGMSKGWGPWNVCSKGPTLSVLWRCPTLPHPPRCSTIGACGLSFQVRNGGWAFPRGYDHHKMVQPVFTCVPQRVGVVLVVIRIVATSTLWCLSTSVVEVFVSVGPLVPVGSRAPRGASTSGLSTR